MKEFLRAAAILGALCSTVAAQDTDLGHRIYSANAPSVLLLYVQSNGEYVAQGTGFLIEGSKIVTNAHVANAGKVFVELGPARIPTTLDKIDPVNDLAILSVAVDMTPKPLLFADKKPSPGDLIFAITNPEGLERTISQGVVSANREVAGRRLLQISTPISHGSSGGPIFNRDGRVIGVAVGMFADGQNLNFAVPIDLLADLLARGSGNTPDVGSLVEQVSSLQTEQAGEKYSQDPDSGYQKKQTEIESLLNKGVAVAGNNPEALLKIAKVAESTDTDIALSTAQRAVDAQPSAESYLLLADILNSKYTWTQGDERDGLMKQAEKAARSSLKLAKASTPEMYYRLGNILEDEGQYQESESVLRNVLLRSDKSSDLYFQAVRNMVLCASGLNHPDEEKRWFSELQTSNQATPWDWHAHAQRLYAADEYKNAGDAYLQAGTQIKRDLCMAGSMYDLSSEPDSALAAYRKCIDGLTGTTGQETLLAQAHASIASTLNDRGVYTEALSHAKEATVLDPSYAFAFATEADALNNLQRFDEAINASKEALRLSDGKYAWMHFTLGTSYFHTENWQLAEKSFEKAADLNPKDDAAPFNVALCYGRLGYYTDAAHWYEEVLRRNPNRTDSAELRQRIQTLLH